MQKAGIEGEQMALVLEDHHLVDNSMLELINSLLSAGEIPGLYTPEEIEPLLSPLRDQASQDGFRGNMISYFASKVSANLHIVLILDSASPNFTAHCESNPAFYKSCSFQWMEGWSKESMLQSECEIIILYVLYILIKCLRQNARSYWPMTVILKL